MTLLNLFFSTAITIITVVVIYKVWTAIKHRTKKQLETHRLSIEPSLSFSVIRYPSAKTEDATIYIKNIGQGKAVDIVVNDFRHPKEKDWCFKFKKIVSLDPGEEKKVDFDFLVGEQKAFNKHDQLWMFDIGHDHEFVAHVVIYFSDSENYTYSQKNILGKGKHQHEKPRLIKLGGK